MPLCSEPCQSLLNTYTCLWLNCCRTNCFRLYRSEFLLSFMPPRPMVREFLKLALAENKPRGPYLTALKCLRMLLSVTTALSNAGSKEVYVVSVEIPFADPSSMVHYSSMCYSKEKVVSIDSTRSRKLQNFSTTKKLLQYFH